MEGMLSKTRSQSLPRLDCTAISVDDTASPAPSEGSIGSVASMTTSRSSRTVSSGSRGGSVGNSIGGGSSGWELIVFRYFTRGLEQLLQLSSFVQAPAIRFVRRDSSQVFSGAQVCHSTKPHPPATPTVTSDQSSRSQISSSHCRFQSFAWVVSVQETEVSVGSNVLIGLERVAAALLMAAAPACYAKASRADARMMKRLASSSPSSTIVG